MTDDNGHIQQPTLQCDARTGTGSIRKTVRAYSVAIERDEDNPLPGLDEIEQVLVQGLHRFVMRRLSDQTEFTETTMEGMCTTHGFRVTKERITTTVSIDKDSISSALFDEFSNRKIRLSLVRVGSADDAGDEGGSDPVDADQTVDLFPDGDGGAHAEDGDGDEDPHADARVALKKRSTKDLIKRADKCGINPNQHKTADGEVDRDALVDAILEAEAAGVAG